MTPPFVRTPSQTQEMPCLNPSQTIAIVGLGGIFPGAMNIAQFWEHVAAGRSLSREVPAGRWPLPADDLYAPQIAPDKVYSKRGCFVDEFACDLTGLNISREQLNRLDPMFHLLLHAGKAAWQDTVTKNIDLRRAGIIIGNIALPTDASSGLLRRNPRSPFRGAGHRHSRQKERTAN